MGREAEATAHWRGAIGTVRVLLESQELILRGEIRARIPRSAISSVTADGDNLCLVAHGEPLVLNLGEPEANRWVTAMLKPLPTLAEKLGISQEKRAFVIGEVTDDTLRTALVDVITDTLDQAKVIVAVLTTESDLETALQQAESASHLPIWCIYSKGKQDGINEAIVRNRMRASGFIDTKVSAVSVQNTATRYIRRSHDL